MAAAKPNEPSEGKKDGADAETANVASLITLKVKTTSDQKFDVSVPTTASVLDLKKAIQEASKEKIDPSLQRLIYKGKVLKDEHKICEPPYNMKDQHTVILVKSRPKRVVPPNQPAMSSNTNPAPAPNANANANANVNPNANLNGNGNNGNANPMANLMNMMGGMGGMGGMGQMGGMQGMGGMGGMLGNMDPQMMANMMENPVFQQITENLLANPQMMQQVGCLSFDSLRAPGTAPLSLSVCLCAIR